MRSQFVEAGYINYMSIKLNLKSLRLQFRLLLMLFVCLVLSSCVSTQENEGASGYYRPAGWLRPGDTLKVSDFADYQSKVTQRVEQHRLIIDTSNPGNEISLVSPAEFEPNKVKCLATEPLGIVILVHGLSDTAFAMRDLAKALAERCYLTRTLLLPGHGTVPGDLLVVRHNDWLDSVSTAVNKAAIENDNVIVIGFSLGAVVGLSAALDSDIPVNSLISISPAFHLSSWRLARWAPVLHRLRPWIDRELPDDRFRYEAMPTRGVAETVRAIRNMRGRLSDVPTGLEIPWMLVQSLDDAVIEPTANLNMFLENAGNSRSRALLFHSEENPPIDLTDKRITLLDGTDAATNVLGLTHVAVQISPNNEHYGVNGSYRNCGSTGGRKLPDVERCLSANAGEFDYALWGKPDDPEQRPSARSTFNPHFDLLVDAIEQFLASS